ncbi:MAG TPA: PepSY-like domain-containing protein [Ignavibacteria bacterium]|nr:PepSY-like domain-containing protein [Ignavibacteria bacterium]HQY51630.1 PepSY-like domain-containing protein [Ignavibacteria bacterium]HRA99102.1 PepSY-like domain-containing protein [Ignavibacteria bacterium]
MKKIILVVFAIAIFSNINAQDIKETDVPEAVKTAFYASYPDADNVEWEIQGAYFEGGIKVNDMVTSVLLDANGFLVQTESQIPASDLPDGVKDYISKNLNNAQIEEAAKITEPTGKVTYMAEVKNSEYMFDPEGKLLYNLQGDSDSGEKDSD